MRIPLTLLKLNTKNKLLQLAKTPALLVLMPVKSTRHVTVLISMMNLRSMQDQTTSKKEVKGNHYSLSNKSQVRKINRDTNLEKGKSLELYGRSD